jgi:hypothetical protein
LDAIRYVRPTPGYGIESIRESETGRTGSLISKSTCKLQHDGLEYLRFRDGLLQSPA